MTDRQILRFVAPKGNDWYTQRSWLPEISSPLVCWDTTIDEVDSWTNNEDDDSNDYDCSDISFDDTSDDSMTDFYGTSSEDGDCDSSDEEVARDDIERLRKWAERRRSERDSAPEPDDRDEPIDPIDSAMDSNRIDEPVKTTTEPDPAGPWYDPQAVEIFEDECDHDPRDYASDWDREMQQSAYPADSDQAPQRPECFSEDAPKPCNQRLAALAHRRNPPLLKYHTSTSTLTEISTEASTLVSVSSDPVIPTATATATAAAADETTQHSEVENPGRRDLELSIRLFAKEQSRVSRDAVSATRIQCWGTLGGGVR